MDTNADIGKAMIAGFVASVVIAVLFMLKQGAGLSPNVDFIQMLSALLNAPDNRAAGWVAHFVIGTIIWGAAFAWLEPYFSGRMWARGVEFGILVWFLAMIIQMPIIGAGFFASTLGFGAVVWSLVFHLIYGAVLGYTYGQLLHLPQGHMRVAHR